MVFRLTNDLIFPNPAYAEEDGLLAIGGDLSTNRLLLAYSNGIFPWPAENYPLLWWSPNPRLVLFPDKFKVSKSLRKTIRIKKFEVKFDTDFEQIITYCANIPRNGQEGSWITPEMKTAYIKLHNLGFAHCIGTYFNGKLVGGLYGISIGAAFFGESMFHLMNDASKVALFYLVEFAKQQNFHYIDAQTSTRHLISLGAEELKRKVFLSLLIKSNKEKTLNTNWKNFFRESDA